ncbi:hypothetical protein H2248_002678 [Termitomyces sp. 'cryptogamus']|nr:hypothetical protein H2248_002678 [Termitomyces sp. 'cryptogamus']
MTGDQFILPAIYCAPHSDCGILRIMSELKPILRIRDNQCVIMKKYNNIFRVALNKLHVRQTRLDQELISTAPLPYAEEDFPPRSCDTFRTFLESFDETIIVSGG